MGFQTTALHIVHALYHAGFPGAVVAGGYLRDSLLGLPPKDIDVFIPKSAIVSDVLAQRLGQAVGHDVKIECNLSYANMEVARIMGTTDRALPIQFIEMSGGQDPKERVARHDFGICQVWVDMNGLDWTEAFEHDRRRMDCTLVHCESPEEHKRSMRRWERLKEKLAGWRLVDPTSWVDGYERDVFA